MKHLCIFIIILITLTHLSECTITNLNLLEKFQSNSHFKFQNKNKNQIQSKNKHSSEVTVLAKSNSLNQIQNKNELNLQRKKEKYPKGKFLWEGWLRFIRITNQPSPMRPTNFFVNPQYNYQRVFKSDLKKKDEIGYLNIKDKFDFFAVLKTEGLYIFKSRKISFDKIVEQIKIVDILKIKDNNKFLGAVREIGNFQEGYCMKVQTKYPAIPSSDFDENSNGHTSDFIICLENKNTREKLINYFVELKFAQQKIQEKDEKKRPAKSMADLNKKLKPASNIDRPKDWVARDGYWILLQDWTSCSLKCGGGLHYQHWMCVPPKKGGKKCKGQAVRTEPCNTQPCPGTIGLLNTSVSTKGQVPGVVLNPIVKSFPFSKRPQNYLKCQIKENDVFYLIDGPDNKKIKRPSRIVMNTHTISIYHDDSYKTAAFAFDLKNTLISPKKDDKCCFDLLNGRLGYTICGGFGQLCGTSSNPKFVNEWVSDFNLFKVGCYENLKIKNWKSEQSKKAMADALEAAGVGGLSDRANLIKKRIEEKKMDEWNKKLQNTQSQAMKLMKREFDIEKMLQQELQLKAELEAKELMELKRREQAKKECLEKAFKERDTQNKRLMDDMHKENELDLIKQNTKKEVELQRNKLREKLNAIRNKFKKRKRLIMQDINVIRSDMAKNLMNANKKGNMLICKNAYGNKEKITDYCNREIVDNYVKNIECRSESSFCYVCCENEFGNLVMEKRDVCYKMCDKMLRDSLNGGHFYWGA